MVDMPFYQLYVDENVETEAGVSGKMSVLALTASGEMFANMVGNIVSSFFTILGLSKDLIKEGAVNPLWGLAFAKFAN